jgi:hypothetical protein
MKKLGIKTDDVVTVYLIHPSGWENGIYWIKKYES